MKTVNIAIAGLGGQGIITASDIVADAAFRSGFDVKKAEVHGMSQRGGSVNTDVRYGPEVLSPMIADGEADVLVIVDMTQVDNNRHRLHPKGTLITADQVDRSALPSPKTLNVALLGILSAFLTLDDAAWRDAIRAMLPASLHAMNEHAFAAGRDIGQTMQ